MYILMADETNTNESGSIIFFIYGGLVLDVRDLRPLTEQIEKIRVQHGLRPGDQLKFDTNSRPDTVSVEDYTAAKNAVVESCFDHGAKFLSYMILHAIAAGKGNEVLIGYGLNTILGMYNFKFLAEENDSGIAIVDRLPFTGGYDFLRDKFQTGLEIEPLDRAQRLDRINLFASSCDGASHLSSAVDIVLGAFRYCVNQSGNSDVPERLFPKIAKMLYAKEVDDERYVREYGLAMRPLDVRVPGYEAEYQALVERLQALAGE